MNEVKKYCALQKILDQNELNILKELTQARVNQPRVGTSICTNEILNFNLDHALARDAIHNQWNFKLTMHQCESLGYETKLLGTQALSRKQYLIDPKSGCFLHSEDEKKCFNLSQNFSISLIVTDGLSCTAIETHFFNFLKLFTPYLKEKKLSFSPIFFVPLGRVALGDHLGEIFKSTISIVFVGERPGLSSFDSMGIYLTYDPKIGRLNSDRNCISNIRPPHGFSYAQGCEELSKLIDKSLENKFSGSQLKLN